MHLKEKKNRKKNWETVADCIEEEISLLILTVFFVTKAMILPSFTVQASELSTVPKK